MRSAARGVIGAMAMTGMRRVALGLGLVRQTPPQAIVDGHAGRLLERLSPERRPVVEELAHWAYGAIAGAAFGVLSPAVRRSPWAGPVYGLVTWLGFEGGVAPILGLPQARERRLVERLALAGDHLLYGVVVGGSAWPNEDDL